MNYKGESKQVAYCKGAPYKSEYFRGGGEQKESLTSDIPWHVNHKNQH